MVKKRNKAPHRNATRKLSIVTDHGISVAEGPPARPEDLAISFDAVDVGAADPIELAEVAAPIGRQLEQQIMACRTALDAEVSLSSLLGLLALHSPESTPAVSADAQEVLLGAMVAWADNEATPGSLALLRALAVIGTEATREAAARSALKRSSAGTPDRPWATAIGKPRPLRAFRYGDIFGSQDSVTVLFDYSHREHAVSVLIDHELGGGIKDCWVAEGKMARGMRNHTAAAMAAEPLALFEDITIDDALDRLTDALAQPPCPVQDDQVEDVAGFLPLLKARVDWLDSQPDRQRPALAADLEKVILQLKVTLQGTKPPVWRRLEVPADVTLDLLHHILQTAFGWTDSHLHSFEPRPARPGRGRPNPDLRISSGRERRTRLGEVVSEVGATMLYEYDFGDSWEHLITVEKVEPAEPSITYPRCTGGRRSGPPEDCGGIPGYAHLLAVLGDPSHEQHEELQDWVGDGFDPEAFDRNTVTAELTGAS